MCGHRALGGGLALDHVAVEISRSPHRLAGVVDDEVESLPRDGQVSAESVDARGVAQVEPEHLEPVTPLAEVGLARVPGGAVTREASRDDQVRARAEQLDPGLVADLHAPAGQESDASREVCDLAALREVEVAALAAELVVERVHLDVVPLADITVLRLDHLAQLGLGFLLGELGRRLVVRRREDGLVPKHPQPGIRQNLLVARPPILLLPPAKCLRAPPAGLEVGVVDLAGRREKAGSAPRSRGLPAARGRGRPPRAPRSPHAGGRAPGSDRSSRVLRRPSPAGRYRRKAARARRVVASPRARTRATRADPSAWCTSSTGRTRSSARRWRRVP